MGIFAVGFADSVLTARVFAGRHNQRIDANQELLAQGLANASAGLTQGFPVGASTSRTAVNDRMGAKTQVVGLVSVAVVALVLLFLTAPFEKLPMACLGAVIVVAAASLFLPDDWRALRAAGSGQVVIAAVTLAVVVAVGVLEALVAAVILSMLDVIARSARPHDAVLGWVPRMGRYADVSVHMSARVTPRCRGLPARRPTVLRQRALFPARVREAIAGAPTPTRWLVFDAQFVTDVDASGVEALEQLCRQLAERGVTFVVARLATPTKERFDATGLTDQIGQEHFSPTVEAAVRRVSRRMTAGPVDTRRAGIATRSKTTQLTRPEMELSPETVLELAPGIRTRADRGRGEERRREEAESPPGVAGHAERAWAACP